MLKQRRFPLGVLGLVIQLSFGCSASSSVLGPDEIAGEYQLVSVMGKPLPAATVPGREELDSARLVLRSTVLSPVGPPIKIRRVGKHFK